MDKNIEIAANHEAGHAIMAYIVGWNIESIKLTIENGTLISGKTTYDFCDDIAENPTNLHRRILCLMGGPIAEILFRKENSIDLDKLGQDGELIDDLLMNVLDKDIIIEDQITLTVSLLNIPNTRLATEEIVNNLIATNNLTQEDFIEIASKHEIRQMEIKNINDSA